MFHPFLNFDCSVNSILSHAPPVPSSARTVAPSSSAPSSTVQKNNVGSSATASALSGGAVAGIVIAVLAATAGLVLAFFYRSEIMKSFDSYRTESTGAAGVTRWITTGEEKTQGSAYTENPIAGRPAPKLTVPAKGVTDDDQRL